MFYPRSMIERFKWVKNSRNHCTVHQAHTAGGFWQDRTTKNSWGKTLTKCCIMCSLPPPLPKKTLLSDTAWDKNTSPKFFKTEKLPESKIKRKLRPEQRYMWPLLKYHDRFLHWKAWVWTYPIRCCFVRHKCQSYVPVGFIPACNTVYLCVPAFFFFYCLFIFSACLSSSLFCCFSVTLFGLFGLKLILSVPAGLGRKTQITITNQTATPTAALTTPISQTFCIYQVCFSRLTSSCPVQSHSLSVPALFTQTNLLSHFSLGPWLISLLSLSVSGLCLFCAHVCPWVPEILMCLCLVIMRTVDGGLKICFSYSDWIAK